MGYPSIRGEELPESDKKATCNLLYSYKDSHSPTLID